MNVVDPTRSADFFVRSFEMTRPVTLAGWPGVQTEDTYILFSKVARQASTEWDSAFWHFGWNTPDAAADYRRLAAEGVPFFRVPPPSGHMRGPDGTDIEIAPGTGGTSGGKGPRSFNHVHLQSEAPLCAAAWYAEHLGMRLAPTPARDGAVIPPPADCHVPFAARGNPANQILTPNAKVFAGEVALFVYPNQRLRALTDEAVERPGPLVSPRGHALDHIGVTVDDLRGTLVRMRRQGVRVLEDVHRFGSGPMEAAFIEGPDAMVIELLTR